MDTARVARPEEVPQIVELVEHVFADNRGKPRFMARMFPFFLSPANAANMHVVADAGRLASFLGVDRRTFITAGCRLPTALVGAVCTHENYAGRRLSGETLQLAYERSRRQGDLVVWISGTRTVYLASGAVCVWPLRRFVITGEPLAALGNPPGDLEPLTAGNLGELLALHDREPAGFEWTPEWLDTVLRESLARKNFPIYLIRQKGRTIAAGCFNVLNREPGSGDLLDWYGDRTAVVQSLGAMAAALGLSTVTCTFVASDPLLSAAQAAGLPLVPRTEITLKVLDFAGLLSALAPHLQRTLGPQAGAITATADGLRVRLGPAEYVTPGEQTAARIIFSPAADYVAEWSAIPAAIRALLAQAFPVPLRHYGLNFI
jgi:hypothetical protein